MFLADQAAGAHEEACELFARMAGARGVDYSRGPSPWVLRLVRRARRMRCAHWPREGSEVVYVAAHRGRMECRACSIRTARALAGSLDEGRCDLCRRSVAELERFGFNVGTLLVTGRCCAGCRPTVYGEAG
ncbi:hypothetical protein [Blastococcus colisei]|uniref:hypothetical protein n=1 Tax=Blastococcus colisei TaxID=1564162 RepID=UPI001152F40A|nr:hypothetical protein [Blastococcus colisei]